MTNQIRTVFVALYAALSLSGCALGAAAGAGYIAADEISEGDGEADILEEARGEGNGKN